MPTVREYKNKPGFRILARPPTAGYITYQVSHSAEKQIRELGYSDGDDIPWTVINVFRRMGEIYTKKSGIDKNKIPTELKKRAIATLSLEQKQKLVTYLLNNDGLTDREKVEMMSEILTVEEWQELVERTSDEKKKIPEKVERAIKEHGTVYTKDLIGEVIYDKKLQESIQQFYEHPWELDELSYYENGELVYLYDHAYEYTYTDSEEKTPIRLVDWRPFDEVHTIPQLDIAGDIQEIDFAFNNDLTYTCCTLHIRNGHIILPEHSYVPEEDEYRHAHLRDVVTSFSLCTDFFEEIDFYDIKNPTPDGIEP